MTISKRNRNIRYNQNLFRYLVQEIWDKKIWFLVAAVLGGMLATLSVYLNPPRYQAKATFISDIPILARQVEILESRDLLNHALETLEHVKVRCYSKGVLGRKSEFYDKTPVLVSVNSFPDHLKNVEMRLDFSAGQKVTLSFEALGEKVSVEGKLGIPLQVGSIGVLVAPTKFWSERFEGETIWFQVQSLNQVAARVARDYRVENLNHRKNRIAVFYTDDNADRAFDVLNAVCQEAMANYYASVENLLSGRLERVERKMNILLDQMAGDENLAEILRGANLRKQNREIDSLAIALQKISSQTRRIASRDSLFSQLRVEIIGGTRFRKEFSFDFLSPSDQELVDLIAERDDLRQDTLTSPDQLRKINVQIDNMINFILVSDSLMKIDLKNEKARIEDYLMTNVDLRNNFVGASIDRRDQNNQGVLIWESYLILARDKYRMEMETLENISRFDLVESPYVINPARRFIQIRKIISGALLGGLLLLTYLLIVAFGRARIKSPEHLRMISNIPLAAFFYDSDPKKAVRNMHTALEMERKTDEKVISVISPFSDPSHATLVDSLAGRYKAAGQKVLVFRDKVNGASPAEPDSDPMVTELPIRLLSRAREEELNKAVENCDLIIQHLPPFRDYPEAWFPASTRTHLIYLARASTISQAEIRELEEMIEKYGFKVYLYFFS